MVAANDPMAGDKDINTVSSNGLCHGSNPLGITNLLSYLHIAPRLSVRDVE